ncbi:hypothetical protein [Allomuricauda sp. SCSIO 65647]|uniref:hypothetical protein n=1 Tax=Allomuricauda sp. SCSIO 65647 TaxID=2908843 RepID=UPI001F24C5D8|nr:hypothetical protein [Muricauda sp. SCSIO 65647]UJH66473.1 hypothetical protein L0P89_10885 [Muricauda sp. SCSIO 65647]
MKSLIPVAITYRVKGLVIILCTLLALQISAQYSVSTCSEQGLRPITSDGQEILAIYLKRNAEGIGGLGCWVHHHPNGKDYVVTPHSWDSVPSSWRKGLIREAMQAITDSRNKYVEYGTMNQPLYYILDDVDRTDEATGDVTQGEKFWLNVEGECWMRSGVPTLRPESPEVRKQIFAHEIGHCFIEENVPKTAYANHDWDAWFDESVSEYLSSEVYKTADGEHQFSVAYDFDSLFTQPYNAYVLWYYYAKQKGILSVVPLMNALTGLKTLKARMNYLQSIEFDELFHNFLYDFTMRSLKDSGTGNPIPGPGINPDADFTLLPEKSEVNIPRGINFGQREIINIVVPEGFNVTLRPPQGSEGKFYSSLMPASANAIRTWDSPVELTGHCFSPMDITVMISHLETDGIGDLVIPYELHAKADCCTAEADTLDGCIIGTWEVDVSTISHLIDYDVSGTLKVSFENMPAGHLNATFNLRFDFDNGDYDTHKGTVSACVVPEGSAGPLNYFRLSGVSLGPENIHTHFYSRRGVFLDQKDDVIEGLNRFRFNYTTCTPDILTVLYMIQMSRVR